MSTQVNAVRPLAVVVLAAGRGTRLAVGEDAPPKVLVDILGAPLLEHVRRALEGLAADLTLVVIGHEAAQVASPGSTGAGRACVPCCRSRRTARATLRRWRSRPHRASRATCSS